MLEPIKAYINNEECNYIEYENLKTFLLLYNNEIGVKFFNEEKLLNMLRYFKLYSGYDISEIQDYGKKFRDLKEKFIEIENQKQRYFKNPTTKNIPYIENPNYLIATYYRLKRTIYGKSQYAILKDTILCLSPIDIEHFINILLRKYSSDQIKQIIKNIENGN